MADKKDTKQKRDWVGDIFFYICAAGGIGCAGYALYDGWGILGAVVALVVGALGVAVAIGGIIGIFGSMLAGLLAGFDNVFGKSSNGDPNRQRRLERWAWLTGKPY